VTPYTLHHGDCLDVLPTLEAQSVDAVICDPPYGTTACKWDSVIPFEPMWRELRRIVKPRGAIVLFGSQPFTSALVMSWPQGFREELVWEKDTPSNFAAAKYVALKYHENIIVFAKERYTYNPQMADVGKVTNKTGKGARTQNGVHGKMGFVYHLDRNATTRYPRTVIRVPGIRPNAPEKVEHPTQKPVALLDYLIRTYTDEGDTVLDFTMGSGTTGVACVNTGRAFVGIERDAGYYAIAERRIAEASQQIRMAI